MPNTRAKFGSERCVIFWMSKSASELAKALSRFFCEGRFCNCASHFVFGNQKCAMPVCVVQVFSLPKPCKEGVIKPSARIKSAPKMHRRLRPVYEFFTCFFCVKNSRRSFYVPVRVANVFESA